MNDINVSISNATWHNWKKLGVQEYTDKLHSRANKTLSSQKIIPYEYFIHKDNIPTINYYIDWIINHHISCGDALYTLGIRLLCERGYLHLHSNSDTRDTRDIRASISTKNQHLLLFLHDYAFTYHHELAILPLPHDEQDFLGLLYQCLLCEGEKNRQGSYYTPSPIVNSLVKDISLHPKDKILDPCCGSLTFPLQIPHIQPEQIFAMDNDPLAVMIAKFNYFLHFPYASAPHIFHGNYLSDHSLLPYQFDYIITNPPWGASTDTASAFREISSGETFSCFLIKSHQALSAHGQLRFLLPESILNVTIHKDIRKYLLYQANMTHIYRFSTSFTGVTTKYISLYAHKTGTHSHIKISDNNCNWLIPKSVYMQAKNHVFRITTNNDEAIISRVCAQKKYDLHHDSIFALGIVTGNNKATLKTTPQIDGEPIYTGKEITPYRLLPPRYYFKYERDKLQQVAKEDIYRTKPKLVYKYISSRLVFAIDNTASMFLNSANILIPHIPLMSVTTVCAFLNSQLYQYLYLKMFGEIKILKGNLFQLPFPEISPEINQSLTSLVDTIMLVNTSDQKIDENISTIISKINEIIYDTFSLSQAERNHIQHELQSS